LLFHLKFILTDAVMQIVKLDTGFNIEIDFVITAFHRRLFAWLIDGAIMIAYSWIIYRITELFESPHYSVPVWLVLLLRLPLLFYHLAFEVWMNGQSPGKKVMHIKVITLEGGQPSLSQYLIRWMFRLIDFPTLILAAVIMRMLPWWCFIFIFSGLACLVFSRNSQRIGDLVAGTIIIDTKTHLSWQDTVFTELASSYQPKFPQVMQLSDKDINTLKSVIETVKKKSNYDLSMRIGERIKWRLHIESDQDSLDFLETLLMDYNYYSTN
jgi:uncharacterized RDD family membrane protein YckC